MSLATTARTDVGERIHLKFPVEMPCGESPILFIDLYRFGEYALVMVPGKQALHPDVELGVGADHVAQAWVGIVSDSHNQLCNRCRTWVFSGARLHELRETLAAFLVG